MKKIILSLALMVATVAASAQSKGEIVVGGSLGFGSSVEKETGKTEEVTDRSSSFSILPEVQYFVTDNISVGASIGYESTKEYAGMTSKDVEMFDRAGAFVFEPTAHYYVKLTDKLYYTPSLYLGITSGNAVGESESFDKSGDSYVKETKVSASSFGIGVNLAEFEYKLTPKIAVAAGLGIGDISYRTKTVGDKKASSFNLSANDAFSIDNVVLSVKYCF